MINVSFPETRPLTPEELKALVSMRRTETRETIILKLLGVTTIAIVGCVLTGYHPFNTPLIKIDSNKKDRKSIETRDSYNTYDHEVELASVEEK